MKVLLLFLLYQAPPETLWTRVYEDSLGLLLWDALSLSDSTYLLIGWSEIGEQSILIAIDEEGDTLWTWRFYGQGGLGFWKGVLAEDGTVVLTGFFGYNVLVTRLDLENRQVLWMRAFSIGDRARGWGIVRGVNGGYVIVGNADMDTLTTLHWLILKVDEEGNLEWYRTYDWSPGGDVLYDVEVAEDGYVAVGEVNVVQGAVAKFGLNGELEWSRFYLGMGTSTFGGVGRDSVEGFIVSGVTAVCGFCEPSPLYVVKVDEDGDLEWQRMIIVDEDGWTAYARGIPVIVTEDGGYVVAVSASSDAYVEDSYVVRLDETGNLLWYIRFGGPDPFHFRDDPNAVLQTWDRGYLVVGFRLSYYWPHQEPVGYVVRLGPDPVGVEEGSHTSGDGGSGVRWVSGREMFVEYGGGGDVEVRVWDVLGRERWQFQGEGLRRIGLPRWLPPGVYMVELRAGGMRYRGKVWKVR